MDRREFLKVSAMTGLGLSLSGGADIFVSEAGAEKAADLVVARGAYPSGLVKAAIDGLGGIKRFISRGDIVVVKPNIAWDRLPEQAATTNPEVVAAVVKLCLEAGAKKVKVFDRTVNDPRRCYVQSGIADAVRRAGAEIDFVEERQFREMSIKGMAMKSWPLYAPLFEADKVINVPIAKHHSLSKLTLAMKNWMGVMGGGRSMIHQKLDESLADLARVIKPTLTILDAILVLTANGPQGGSLGDVKRLDTVIAGTDQVAVDSYGATLFGMKGSDLGYLKIAAQAGLGRMDLSSLTIKKINY